jgi:DNA-binding LytR/AlgR family response regulator
MIPLRVLLVDDEPLARKRLARLLAQCAGTSLVGECGDGQAAASLIRTLSPDVVLLDIRMPGLDGLTLAAHLARTQAPEPARPLVIFTTAHADHALEAFDAAALDYLLKPIELPRLARALDRARARLAALAALPTPASPIASAPCPPLRSGLADLLAPPLRLTARSGDTFRLFDPAAITRLWSQDKYTAFLHDGVEHLLDESLTTLEQRLAPLGFLRVHRSELVALHHIRALHLDGDLATLELDDGQRAPVSRRYLPQLRRRLAGA